MKNWLNGPAGIIVILLFGVSMVYCEGTIINMIGCTPDCTSKFCGDSDGCGGTCTACQNAGTHCNTTNWQCQSCVSQCSDKCGGPDSGCLGQYCPNTCGNNQTCDAATNYTQCKSCTDGCTGDPSACGCSVGEQIIADHTIVSRYSAIPQEYINKVKEMWVNIPGESHSAAYRSGIALLAQQDLRFPAVVTESGNPPEAYTSQHLRISGHIRDVRYSSWSYGAGEKLWYTWYAYPIDSRPAEKDIIKNHIQYSNTNGLTIAAIGFGWCWDMTWQNGPGGEEDTVYNVHWAGSSEGGPDGNLRWGLDSGDYDLTGNRVSMDTYLFATEEYRNYCLTNGYATKVIFTTGPVDGSTGESGYQRHIKHEYMRNFVKMDSNRILFDYADILSFDDDGQQASTIWNGNTYPIITSINAGDGSVGHIGSAGALRLAKAMWWMLARIAGWDGN